eukprot:7713195-Pyramimonas_sp.AAC.1
MHLATNIAAGPGQMPTCCVAAGSRARSRACGNPYALGSASALERATRLESLATIDAPAHAPQRLR